MNRKITMIILGVAAVLAAIGIYAFSSSEPVPMAHSDEAHGDAPDADHGDEGHTDKPGDAIGGETDEEGLVVLTPQQLKDANIGITQAKAGGIAELVVPATVAARPDSMATIDARASGVVRDIRKNLGDYVRQGEAVARIESAEAASLAAARSAAQARVNELAAIFDREKRLFDQNVTARQELEAANANLAVARAELARAQSAAQAAGVGRDGRSLAVTSPISGQVTAASLTLGSFVSAGDELYRVVNPNGLQIEVAIPAADIARVSRSDIATFSLPNGDSGTAKVRSITPSLDAENRTGTAVLALRRAPPGLQPGTFLEVRLQASRETDPGLLSVPDDAVQTVDGQAVVFIRVENGFRAQPVETGARSAGMVTILSGLRDGQQIASENAFLLKGELEKDEAGHGH